MFPLAQVNFSLWLVAKTGASSAIGSISAVLSSPDFVRSAGSFPEQRLVIEPSFPTNKRQKPKPIVTWSYDNSRPLRRFKTLLCTLIDSLRVLRLL